VVVQVLLVDVWFGLGCHWLSGTGHSTG